MLLRILLVRLLSEGGRQRCTMPEEEEKLIQPSAKAPTDPIIFSVNKALASSLPTHPGPIFLALLCGNRPTPSQRLSTEVKGLVAKNRCAGAVRTFADMLPSCTHADREEGEEGSGAAPPPHPPPPSPSHV